jgi:hypothetical protein
MASASPGPPKAVPVFRKRGSICPKRGSLTPIWCSFSAKRYLSRRPSASFRQIPSPSAPNLYRFSQELAAFCPNRYCLAKSCTGFAQTLPRPAPNCTSFRKTLPPLFQTRQQIDRTGKRLPAARLVIPSARVPISPVFSVSEFSRFSFCLGRPAALSTPAPKANRPPLRRPGREVRNHEIHRLTLFRSELLHPVLVRISQAPGR